MRDPAASSSSRHGLLHRKLRSDRFHSSSYWTAFGRVRVWRSTTASTFLQWCNLFSDFSVFFLLPTQHIFSLKYPWLLAAHETVSDFTRDPVAPSLPLPPHRCRVGSNPDGSACSRATESQRTPTSPALRQLCLPETPLLVRLSNAESMVLARNAFQGMPANAIGWHFTQFSSFPVMWTFVYTQIR